MAYIGLKQLDPILTGSLQVSGSVGFTGSLSVRGGDKIFTEADEGTYLQSDGADRLRAVVGGSQMLLMDQDDGRVNIGYGQKLGVGLGNNTTPGVELEVHGDISGSSTGTGSFGRVVATTLSGDGSDLTNVFEGTTPSASISTRITAAESELGNTLISSSAQLATDISGSWQGSIDISSDTNLVGGTNITLTGDTLNVDDAFLVNSGDDTTSGTITAGGFTTTATGSFGRVEADVLEAKTLVISSSVTNITIATRSGSTEFGDSADDTHTFTGHITASGDISASGYIYGDGTNITGVTAEWDGSHTGDAQITGSLNVSSSFSISDIEVDTSESVRDEVLKFNGTKWVSAVEGYTFVFSIASFSDGESTSQIAGTAGATWKAADAITFTATYNNGPPTTAAISESTTSTGVSDWTTPFATDDNTVAITYPNPGSTRRFRLIADGESDYETSITFKNYIYYGASTQADSYNESFIEGLSSTLSEDRTQNNLSINASGDKYVFWTYPNRLGTVPNYFIWGTSTSNQVVIATSVIGSAYSVTNSAGLTENYKIYRSDITVDESGRLDTGVSLINYIYWGSTGHDSIPGASGWDSDDIKNLEFKTDSNDQTQVWTEITSMTSDYILLCIPSRITDPASFWDNSTGFGADFESSVTVSVINQYGYTENYDVFRSTNTVTGDFTLETK